MKIYKTVWEDRHDDDAITVHLTLDEASAQLDAHMEEYDEDEDSWSEYEATVWERNVHHVHEDGPRGHVEAGELELGPEVKVVIFVEGSFRGAVECDWERDAQAYAHGYCASAQRRGETVALYILPRDIEELVADEKSGEIRPGEVKMALDAAQVRA